MSAVYANNIVIDLEFTPVEKGAAPCGLAEEIIEIGAVRVDALGNIVDSFKTLVRPAFSGRVDARVVKITGITTKDVECAPSFAEAFAAFLDWAGAGRHRMVSWSDNDEHVLKAQCAACGIALPKDLERWLDLQRLYLHAMGMTRGNRVLSLAKATEWAGVDMEQRQEHRALSDAEVTAELLASLMHGDHVEQKRAYERAMHKENECGGFGAMAAAFAALRGQLVLAPAVI